MEIVWSIYDNDAAPITGGAASTSIKIRRVVDDYLLDWNDMTFKAAGWTTPATTLAEISAVNLPGAYRKVIDVSAWADGYYHAVLGYSSGLVVRNGAGEFYLLDGLEVDPTQGATKAELDAAQAAIEAAIISKYCRLFMKIPT